MKTQGAKQSFVFRKAFSVFLCVVLCLGFVPSMAFAAPSIALTDTTVQYTGDEIHFPDDSISISGLSAGDTVHFIYSNNLSTGTTPIFTENAYPTYCGKYRVYATINNAEGTKLADSGNATSFVIVPKPVKITAATAEKPYDGTPLKDSSYTVDTALGIGDTIGTVTVVGSQLPVGNSPNKVTSATILKSGVDVSSNYNFTFVDGTLTVTDVSTTVTLADKTAEYSASPIAIEPATVVGSSAAPTYHYYSDAACTNELAGPPTDANTYYVIAKVAADSLYQAGESAPAKLTITPRPLKITANDATKEWDGTPLTSDTWNNTGNLAPHTVSDVTITGSQTEVGDSPAVPSGGKVEDEKGKDVTANYVITYVNGTLKVVPASPKIVVPDKTVIYDGNPVKSDPAEVKNVDIPWNPSELTYYYFNSDYQQLPAGTYPTVPDKYRVIVMWTDPTGTYTLPNGTATLTILKRGDPGPDPNNPLPEVKIIAPSAEKIYDGTPLTKNDPNDCTSVNLAPGHTIGDGTKVSGSQTEVGSSPNVPSDAVILDAKGNDVTAYYANIKYVDGTLKVTPKSSSSSSSSSSSGSGSSSSSSGSSSGSSSSSSSSSGSSSSSASSGGSGSGSSSSSNDNSGNPGSSTGSNGSDASNSSNGDSNTGGAAGNAGDSDNSGKTATAGKYSPKTGDATDTGLIIGVLALSSLLICGCRAYGLSDRRKNRKSE